MKDTGSSSSARSLERGISLFVIAAMIFSFGWAISTLGPAKAQEVQTIEVSNNLATATTFNPSNITIVANEPFRFVLVAGEVGGSVIR